MAASTLLSATYGYEVVTSDDELVRIVEEANKGLVQAALSGSKCLFLLRITCLIILLYYRVLCERHPMAPVHPVLASRCWVEASGEQMAGRQGRDAAYAL